MAGPAMIRYGPMARDTGGFGDDELAGDSAQLYGGAGNDLLYGGEAHYHGHECAWLDGGDGNDLVLGGGPDGAARMWT
jgi:hypothetical protein